MIPDFEKKLQEDAVLVIRKCGVGEQKDRFPVILLKKKINFYKCTEVSEAVGFRGHPYGFCFRNFPEIDEKLVKEVHTVGKFWNFIIMCATYVDIFNFIHNLTFFQM